MTQRYEVKGKLGHGGLGEVYLAYDTQLDREVALKRVRPQEETEAGAKTLAVDLVREAKTLSALQHPNIVTIYDVGRDEKGPFVIMEYLKGETMDQVIERGKLSAEDFREIVLQVMEGMVAAQSLGLVHRDLKPGNLMVNWLPSGKMQIKILDFGLAKFSRLAVPQTKDQEEGIMGSIFFMAPEQFERLPLDSRTDMYSLGCIFYQLLTQKHPFGGSRGVDVMVSHLQHLVTPLHGVRPDLPAWMSDWVMWLISREMDDRPQDAAKALEFFNAQKSGLPSAAPAVKATAAVRVVGRGGVTQPVPVARQATQAIPAVQSTPAKRTGTHTSAVSSRPKVRRADGHVKLIPKAKIHWVSVITGLIILLIAFGIFWKVYSDGTKRKPDVRDVLETVKGPAPEGTPAIVKDLVKLAATGGENEKDALAVLMKLKGKGVPQAIATELESAKSPLRELLMGVAAVQPTKESIAYMAKVAVNETGPARAKALDAIAIGGTPADVPELIKQAAKFNDADSRKNFYKTVENLLSKVANRDSRVEALAPALKDADSASRPAIYLLLGATGSEEANKILAREIAAGGARGMAAIEALKSWNGADAALADSILDAAKTGDREKLTGAYCRTLTRISAMPAAEVVAGLRKAMPLADNAKAREQFAAALGTLGTREALDFANQVATGPDAALAAAVKPAVDTITTHLAAVRKLIKGENVLDGSDAIIVSETPDATYSSTVRYVTGWRSPQTRLAWDIEVPAAMSIEVEVMQSALRKDHTFLVSLGSETKEIEVKMTKSSDDFERVSVGKFNIIRPGTWRIWLEPGRMTENEALMNVRSVTVRVE